METTAMQHSTHPILVPRWPTHALRWVAATTFLLVAGCTNQTTPEGYEGYIAHTPLVFGESRYVGSQVGPTSTGVVWRQFVTNVDTRPKNYSEEFHILSKDNLSVGFHAHVRISILPGAVKRVIEDLGGPASVATQTDVEATPLPEWYVRNVQQPFRTAVRDVVHGYEAYVIQKQTQEIATRILERLQEEWGDSPIVFETLSIGNLTYPKLINVEIQKKLAAEQDLERMSRERQIAQEQAEITITTARGRAAAQRIVNETLTPLYVQHEMIEGMKALSRTNRATIVSAPSGGGGSGVLLNVGSAPAVSVGGAAKAP